METETVYLTSDQVQFIYDRLSAELMATTDETVEEIIEGILEALDG